MKLSFGKLKGLMGIKPPRALQPAPQPKPTPLPPVESDPAEVPAPHEWGPAAESRAGRATKPRDDSLDWLLSSMMWLFKGGDLGADRRPLAEAKRLKRRARKCGSSS